MLGSVIKEKSQETRSVANERSGRYVFLKVLQMKVELQGIGSRFNEKQICLGSSKDVCAISQLSAGAFSLGAPPPRKYQVDGFLEKRLMNFSSAPILIYYNLKELESTDQRRRIKPKTVPFKRSKLYSRSASMHKEDRFHSLVVEVPNDGHLKVQLVSMMSKHQVSLCVNFAAFSVSKNKRAKKNCP